MSESDIDVKGIIRRVPAGPGERFEKGVRVLAIGLNQTIDRTITLDALTPGAVLRATGVEVTAGGKALNVCRAAHTLDAQALLVGPFPGALGRFAVDLIGAEDIAVEPVAVAGELRGTTIVIEASGRTTVVNEPGPELDVHDWNRVLDAVHAALGAGDLLVAICGSAPPGAPDDAHRVLIELIHALGGRVAVDVNGPRLIAAARAGADLVSPNLAEAEQALGLTGLGGGEPVDSTAEPAEVVDRAIAAAVALVHAGAGNALVSAGHHGVAYRSPSAQEFVHAPRVAVVNPIGAGDALLGATLVALERDLPLELAVRHGVAYAAASVAHPVAGYADRALVGRLTADLAPAGGVTRGARR